jgi:hypothetical protein
MMHYQIGCYYRSKFIVCCPLFVPGIMTTRGSGLVPTEVKAADYFLPWLRRERLSSFDSLFVCGSGHRSFIARKLILTVKRENRF